MDRTQYKHIGRQIVWIIILANGLGAMLISIYYVVIAPVPQGDAPVVQSTPLSFLPTILGTSFLLILGTLMVRYAQRYTPRWSEFLLNGGDPEALPLPARREVLNLVPWTTFTTLTMWLLAGLFMSDFPGNWRGFLVTLGVGGVLTTAIVFLATEIAWRPAIPFFFPKGQLRVPGTLRISVLTRLVIVFLLITLYPAGLLTLVAFDRATVLLTAPNPQAVLQNMLVGIVFILIISLVASLGLAILVARLIVHPLNGLEEAMQKVEQGLLEVSVPVYSNDELGYLTGRFNEMILGLKRAELLRTLLNLYVSPEVARNAVEHGTALGGQVVECTVLFSDIRGFTTLSENMPPADLIDLLNRYMSVMVEAIVSQGGMVNKFGGDSLLAVFGTPLNPSPKHAARAVRAAQGMFAALAQFNAAQRAQNAPELKIGIGLASGPVVAGNIGGEGRIEYTVIGDTVNLASRLQSLTKDLGRDILMNAPTVKLAAVHLTLETDPLPPVTVRGKAEAVQVYALRTSVGEIPG